MILQTKLHRPITSPELQSRQRLYDLLDAGLTGTATLVSAPAGYGKSTVVSQWAERRTERCAWLSVDASDSDLRVFLEYLVAAVRTAIPNACPETLALLRAADLPPVAVLAGHLVNELDSIETRFLIVLDDLQDIADSAVYELLDVLLKYPPRSLYLVMVTRRDPPLALSKLRASGQLQEVRLRDLAFNASETEALLERGAGISISADALATVQTEVEGWAVGLRLVQLLLRNEQDPNRVLLSLKGPTQHVEQYLIQEVLARQSPVVRDWLLRTAILERFCASLCEAVFGGNRDGEASIDGRDFIETLVGDGLFAIELDSEGEWYRYHRSFQRLLRDQLERESDTESIAALHSRASQWFESENLIPEAIEYSLSGGDTTAAAEIVERNRSPALDSTGWHMLESWLNRLPAEIRRERLGILLADAWISVRKGDLGRFAALLERSEALDGDPQLLTERTFLTGLQRFWSGDGARSEASFNEVLGSVPEGDSWIRADSELFRGMALHISGRSEDAIRRFEAAIVRNPVSGGLVWSRLVTGLSFLRLLRGELSQACNEAIRLEKGTRRQDDLSLEAWIAYVLGSAALQRFDLVMAREHLSRATLTILHTRAAHDSVAGLALACQMTGRPEEADAHVAHARETAQWSDNLEKLAVAGSCEARIALLRGDLDAAARWQRSFRQKSDLPPTLFSVEVPCITECRVLAATGDKAGMWEATEKLKHLWHGFGALHYTCQRIEIEPLQALVLHRLGGTDEALKVLEQSLALATPGGWVRPYVELGAPMADLLERLPAESAGSALVRRIQAAFLGEAEAPRARTGLPFEHLTNRERDVLELLALRLRDKEIAERLIISPGTVKSHLKTLYQKLNCGDRRQAVVRARELGVLASR